MRRKPIVQLALLSVRAPARSPATRWRRRDGVGLVLAAAIVLAAGCDGTMRKADLFSFSSSHKEQWTIFCLKVSAAETPKHAEQCKTLAEILGKVKGLRASKVRVETDSTGSTIYYGKYVKTASKETEQLIFPPNFQRDVELIRSLSQQGTAYQPFFGARPQLIDDEAAASKNNPWNLANAKGTHSLLIAVFYNTPTFQERRQAAEQYVQLLREEGFPAYFYHQPARSFVFVGDFHRVDIIETPDGLRYGPRVEELIARRPDAFQYFTENGHVRRFRSPNGEMMEPRPKLFPLPTRTGGYLGYQ